MNLKIQIIILVFSFVFGGFFGVLVNLNYKLIFNSNLRIWAIGTFSLILDLSLLYFFLIKKINYATLHPYFLLVLFLGFYVGFSYSRFLRK